MGLRDNGAPSTVRINLFGGLWLVRGGADPVQIAPGKTGSLLGILALQPGRPMRRAELLALLWPDREPDKAYQNLRQCLHSLRGILQDREPDGVLLVTREHVSLRAEAISTDAAEFTNLVAASSRAEAPRDRIAVLRRAADLYRGPLLAGFDHDAIIAEQHRYAAELDRAIAALIGGLESLGDVKGALEYAAKQALADPTSEAACLQLMRLHALAGEPAAVQRAYREYVARHLAELGQPPAGALRVESEKWRLAAEERRRRATAPPGSVSRPASPPAQLADPVPIPRGKAKSSRLHPAAAYAVIAAASLVLLVGWLALPGHHRASGRRSPPSGTVQHALGPSAGRLADSDHARGAGLKEPGAPLPAPRKPGTAAAARAVGSVTPPLPIRPAALGSEPPASSGAARAAAHPAAAVSRDRGEAEWAAAYEPQSGDKTSEPTAMAIDARGNVYITGFIMTALHDVDYLTLKYSPGGKLLWQMRYNGPANDVDRARAIAVDRQGDVYVTGDSAGLKGHGPDRLAFLDIATIKYRGTDGKQLWLQRYAGDSDGRDAGYQIALDNQGYACVAGRSWGGDPAAGGTGMDTVLIRYAPDGSLIWVRRYPTYRVDFERRVAMAMTPGGNVYLAADAVADPRLHSGSQGCKMLVLLYDRNGRRRWAKTYGSAQFATVTPECIGVSSSGEAIVAGWGAPRTQTSDTHQSYVIVYFTKDGRVDGFRTIESPDVNARPVALAVDSSDATYVTGYTWGSYHSGIETVHLDASSGVVWQSWYRGQNRNTDCKVCAVCVDSAGSPYIAGLAGYPTLTPDGPPQLREPEFTTVGYSAADAKRFSVLRYRGADPFGMGAECMAVDPDDHVVVAGQAAAGQGYSIVTVKYRRMASAP